MPKIDSDQIVHPQGTKQLLLTTEDQWHQQRATWRTGLLDMLGWHVSQQNNGTCRFFTTGIAGDIWEIMVIWVIYLDCSKAFLQAMKGCGVKTAFSPSKVGNVSAVHSIAGQSVEQPFGLRSSAMGRLSEAVTGPFDVFFPFQRRGFLLKKISKKHRWWRSPKWCVLESQIVTVS